MAVSVYLYRWHNIICNEKYRQDVRHACIPSDVEDFNNSPLRIGGDLLHYSATGWATKDIRSSVYSSVRSVAFLYHLGYTSFQWCKFLAIHFAYKV